MNERKTTGDNLSSRFFGNTTTKLLKLKIGVLWAGRSSVGQVLILLWWGGVYSPTKFRRADTSTNAAREAKKGKKTCKVSCPGLVRRPCRPHYSAPCSSLSPSGQTPRGVCTKDNNRQKSGLIEKLEDLVLKRTSQYLPPHQGHNGCKLIKTFPLTRSLCVVSFPDQASSPMRRVSRREWMLTAPRFYENQSGLTVFYGVNKLNPNDAALIRRQA